MVVLTAEKPGEETAHCVKEVTREEMNDVADAQMKGS